MTADIYADWLPGNFYYAFHLFAWMGPIVVLQWIIGWRIFRANLRAVFWPPILLGSYLIATDVIAVHLGIWYFDPDLILAGAIDASDRPILFFLSNPFGVPIEEWAFFYLTALLCSQSFVLFLPDKFRHGGERNGSK